MSSRPNCLFCEQPAEQRHHPTGRSWDPEVTVPVCHDHHMLVHDDWWTAGVGPNSVPPTWLHVFAITALRWAMIIGRLADDDVVPDLLRPLAAWLAKGANCLKLVIEALDRHLGTEWQALPGIAVPLPVAMPRGRWP